MQDRETAAAPPSARPIALSVLLLILAAVYIIVQLYAISGAPTAPRRHRLHDGGHARAARHRHVRFGRRARQRQPRLPCRRRRARDRGHRAGPKSIPTPPRAPGREELDRLDRQIDLLTKSENSVGSDLTLLTTQTQNALYDLLDQLEPAAYTGMRDAIDEFLLAQNRLQVSTGQSGALMRPSPLCRRSATPRPPPCRALPRSPRIATVTSSRPDAARPLALSEEELKNDPPPRSTPACSSRLRRPGPTGPGASSPAFPWRFYGVCTLAQADASTA